MPTLDVIPVTPNTNTAELFAMRAARTPDAIAYREFDSAKADFRDITWKEAAHTVSRVRAALAAEGLAAGERVAIMLKNSLAWVAFDQGAVGRGLVTVPLYMDDRPDNLAYIINDAEVKVILCDGDEHVKKLAQVADQLSIVKRIVTTKRTTQSALAQVIAWEDWLPASAGELPLVPVEATSLATIVYTSGTTGKPKGVMLSHRNLVSNAAAGLAAFDVYADDIFLSFLPLSHMFERTVGYVLTMMAGSTVAFARSVPQLADDLKRVRPTVMVAVPRIFERLHATVQDQLEKASAIRRGLFSLAWHVGWRHFQYEQRTKGWSPLLLIWPPLKKLVATKLMERFGGRLRLCISGGAALNPTIAHEFLGLGLPICQGYGLTEGAPVVSVNRLDKNDPSSIGQALPGIEVKLGENNALLVKGPNVMMGYWKRPQDTANVISADGWLNTGDQAKIDADGVITITGRIKDIIVLGNGEKVPPVDMELAIQLDPLFEQTLIVGEAKPYLSALVVINPEHWQKIAAAESLDADPVGATRDKAEKVVLKRIGHLIKGFPGYAQVRKVTLVTDRWTVENGLMTPTLKLKRAPILERHKQDVEAMYKGHV